MHGNNTTTTTTTTTTTKTTINDSSTYSTSNISQQIDTNELFFTPSTTYVTDQLDTERVLSCGKDGEAHMTLELDEIDNIDEANLTPRECKIYTHNMFYIKYY